jgi:hypothetical protein
VGKAILVLEFIDEAEQKEENRIETEQENLSEIHKQLKKATKVSYFEIF